MVTRIELAQHFNVSATTIRHWTLKRKMPHKKFGGRYMYDLKTCEYWVKKNKPWMIMVRVIEDLESCKNGQN